MGIYSVFPLEVYDKCLHSVKFLTLCSKEILNNLIKNKDCNLFSWKENVPFEPHLSLFRSYRLDTFPSLCKMVLHDSKLLVIYVCVRPFVSWLDFMLIIAVPFLLIVIFTCLSVLGPNYFNMVLNCMCLNDNAS